MAAVGHERSFKGSQPISVSGHYTLAQATRVGSIPITRSNIGAPLATNVGQCCGAGVHSE
jgi:hypothetical protein